MVPGVLLMNFADSGINLELGFWVADPEKGTGQLRSDINLRIWREFRDCQPRPADDPSTHKRLPHRLL